MKEINIALFECDPFNGNKGVAALAYSAISIIDEIMTSKHQSYKIYLVGWATAEYKNTIDINGKAVEFHYINPIDWSTPKDLLKLLFLSVIPYGKYRYYKYLKFDFALNAGSGDSFADIYGKKRFNRINRHLQICNFLKIPQILLPQTIGPFKDTLIRNKAVESMDNCKLIMARDQQSYNYCLSTLNISSQKCMELIDMAFFLPYTKKVQSDKTVRIGINVSGLLWKGGYTKDNQFNLTLNYQELIRKTIRHFLSIKGVTVYLVAHAINRATGTENDYAVNKLLIEEFNCDNLRNAPFFETPIEAKNFISSLDFFTGARMHSTIAAFSSGVPVIPMSYSRKFEGLFCDTMRYKHVVHMCSDNIETSIKKINEAFLNREMIKNEIAEALSTIIKERKSLLYKSLQDFFNVSSNTKQ